jgi:hypothetical protein
MTFGAKLDGLAIRNTTGSGRDMRNLALCAAGAPRSRLLSDFMTSEKTTVLCL